VRLRTTLTLGILAATLAMFVAVGFVAVPAAKLAVRDRIDDRVQADLPVVRQAFLTAQRLSADRRTAAALGGGEHAVILLDGERTRVLARSGLAGDRDPPPDLSSVGELAGPNEVAYAAAADGSKYRYATAPLDDGRRLAVATPVDDLRALVDELVWTLSVIGVAGGGALALASWWWIRRTTRPIERLTERADAIATGDSDRSLCVPASTAELRRLTQALDEMIATVDASLTARQQSEARLRDFVANASHELRTPLSIISGYLQLDVDGALADHDQHRRSMGRALAETTRMRRIVGDLQLLTELDEDLLPDMTELELNAVIAEAVQDARTVDPSRTWVAALAATALVVRADPDQLRQVIANVVGNVRKHTPPGTVANITTRARPEGAVIEVADTGPGVPADELHRIFDRFWRHDRARASGGSGLGLSIVESIVHAHGGTVAAEAPPGRGLLIRIALPLADVVGLCDTPPGARRAGDPGSALRSPRFE
jgi:two-component system, OmpR family, sensor kinase